MFDFDELHTGSLKVLAAAVLYKPFLRYAAQNLIGFCTENMVVIFLSKETPVMFWN